MSLDSIDIGSDGYLALHANCAGTKREIDIGWKGMGKRTAESKRHLHERLGRVAQTLQSVQGRKMLKINATYDDGRISGE
jgi:50S ribosomal subunit-associated GTPase HflX